MPLSDVEKVVLWSEMMILDDFLLSLCPDPETGKFQTTPEGSCCDSGIPNGTPPDEQYAALMGSIGARWESITKMVSKL